MREGSRVKFKYIDASFCLVYTAYVTRIFVSVTVLRHAKVESVCQVVERNQETIRKQNPLCPCERFISEIVCALKGQNDLKA